MEALRAAERKALELGMVWQALSDPYMAAPIALDDAEARAGIQCDYAREEALAAFRELSRLRAEQGGS